MRLLAVVTACVLLAACAPTGPSTSATGEDTSVAADAANPSPTGSGDPDAQAGAGQATGSAADPDAPSSPAATPGGPSTPPASGPQDPAAASAPPVPADLAFTLPALDGSGEVDFARYAGSEQLILWFWAPW